MRSIDLASVRSAVLLLSTLCLSAPALAQSNIARTCAPGNNTASQQLTQNTGTDFARFSGVPDDARFEFVARQNGGPQTVRRSGARFVRTGGTLFSGLNFTLGPFGRNGSNSAVRTTPRGSRVGQTANFRIEITGSGAPRRTAWTIRCLDDSPTVTTPAAQTADPFAPVSVSVTAQEPNDPDPVATYAWTAPADIVLVDADTPNPSFIAPFVAPGAAPRTITLGLTVTDDDGDQVTTSAIVTVNPSQMDLSDAPASYQDAAHIVDPNIQLGALNDVDNTLLASPNADGDGADDDGVTLPELTQNRTATLTAQTGGAGGFLQAWIDFDGNGTFDAGEQIATDLQDGAPEDTDPDPNTMTFAVAVPSDAVTTPTFTRFRWSTQAGLGATGLAPDGEVEDYALTILPDPLASLPPFACTGDFYQVHGTPTSSVSLVDLTTGSFNTIANTGESIRATGFDPSSLLAYGIEARTGGAAGNVLFAIGSDGSAVNLGPVTGLAARNHPSGDFGPNGLLYVRNNGRNRPLVAIDVDAGAVVSAFTPVGLTNNPSTADFAFNPVDQSFYSVESNSTNARLLRFTLNTNSTFTVASAGATGISTRGNNGNNVFGAMYADQAGNVYGIQNANGRLYQFSTLDGSSVLVGQAAIGAQNDGFSCSIVETIIPRDFGDAQTDGTVVAGITTDYGEASQARDPGNLFLGVEAPTAEQSNINASDNADGDDHDEAVLVDAFQHGTGYRANLSVFNTTGGDAFVCGFVDAGSGSDGFDGTLDTGSERTCATVPNSNASQNVTLDWTGLDFGAASATFVRFRLATVQAEAEAPTGEGTAIGEVEDYRIAIVPGIIPVSGTVFFDNGLGTGATAHNGLIEGEEAGIGGVSIQATDVATGATSASVQTAGDGTYTLDLPPEQNGRATRVQLTPPNTTVLASHGSAQPAATFDPASGTFALTPTIGESVTALDFGLVTPPRLTEDQSRTLQAGGVTTLSHTFTANTDMQAGLALENITQSVEGAFTISLFSDTDCDGAFGAADGPLGASIAVSAGQQVCVLVRVASAADAATGVTVDYDLQASATYSGLGPGFAANLNPSLLTNSDRVTIANGGSLRLTKQVCNTALGPCDTATGAGFSLVNRGAPGDVLIYRIVFEVTGSEPVDGLDISDRTPAYSSLTATPPAVLTTPNGVTCTPSVPAAPAQDYVGLLGWTCTGTAAPGSQGAVIFEVKISD